MGATAPARPQTPWIGLMVLGVASQAHSAPKPAGCLIEPDQVVDVGSPVTGVLERLPVALGDIVQEGQTLAVLRTDVERANAQVSTLRAQVDAEVKAAAANVELTQQKMQRTRQLVAQEFVSKQALDQARTEAEVASQKLSLSRSQQRIYVQEQAVAQAQLALRTLRSPIKGIVIERYSHPGERVEDRPVVRIATIDPLRVSLMVPMAQYGQVAVGDALTIRPDLNGVAPVRATVSYVDKVVDAASNTFRVRMSLPNPGYRLPGGLRCKVDWPTAAAHAPKPAPSIAPAVAPLVSPDFKHRAAAAAVGMRPVSLTSGVEASGLTLRATLTLSEPRRASWWDRLPRTITSTLASTRRAVSAPDPKASSPRLALTLAMASPRTQH